MWVTGVKAHYLMEISYKWRGPVSGQNGICWASTQDVAPKTGEESGGFGKCFYSWYCAIQLGKHHSNITCCKEKCVAT